MTGTARIRLDQLLTDRELVASRSRARDAILRGCVSVSGVATPKPGTMVPGDASIHINDPAQRFVSRAALKLVAALDETGFEIDEKQALDLGASTGGFTQVLLERGASHVIALDVGHGQMAQNLREDPRVTCLENFNARDLQEGDLAYAPQIIVSDMSFISLRIAAEPAMRLAAPAANAILLVKPQFEVGREGIGKNGIVSDSALVERTVSDLRQWFDALPGWRVTHFLPSPIEGGDGNREYLLCGVRDD